MLDWLKPILDDGYNEEIDNKIAAEINKGFVTKADYDAAKDAQRLWPTPTRRWPSTRTPT
mgnify:CR=1 FL=1